MAKVSYERIGINMFKKYRSPKSTVTKDSAYFSFQQQKTISSTHVLKRVPGYADPRFKKYPTLFCTCMRHKNNLTNTCIFCSRVTNVKRSQIVSTESLQTAANQSDATTYTEHPCRKEIEKPMLDKNINMYTMKFLIENIFRSQLFS